MATTRYTISFDFDDATDKITNVEAAHKHTTGVEPHGNPINIHQAGGLKKALKQHGLGVTDIDQDMHAHCSPIQIYSKNPSCVRVGGWLFCI